jgi:(p)ppGpp synthase/HD superfamily hydrolase
MNCVKCGKEAEYDTPESLCLEHWADWWAANSDPAKFEDNKKLAYEATQGCRETPQEKESSWIVRSWPMWANAEVMSSVTNAFMLATEAHNGQSRKYTGLPYITHPIRVALAVASWPGSTSTMIAAALLHDTLEDTGLKPERIEKECGEKVLKYVKDLTNPSKGMSASRSIRKQVDRDHLLKVDRQVKIIKMLDRIDNLREMQDAPSNFRRLYMEESMELLKVLAPADKDLGWQLFDAIISLCEPKKPICEEEFIPGRCG